MLACLENYLFKRIRKLDDQYGDSPREIIQEMLDKNMIQNPKQAWATLAKWDRQGFYNYGCCSDLGWKENWEKRKPRQN